MVAQKKGLNVAVIALVIVQLIFGLNYAASKVILEQFPPVLWGAIRMSIAAFLMFICAGLFVPRYQRRVDRKFLAKTFLYALFGIAFTQAFFMLGLKYTTTSNAAILNSLTPIFTLMFAILARKEMLTWARAFGFIVAIAGVLILKNVENYELSSETFRGDFFTLLNCASLALFFTMTRDFLRKNSAFWATAWMFFFGAIMLIIGAVPDITADFHIDFSGRLWWAIFFNIFFATMVTYFLNSWTLKRVNASSVALFIYLQPAIAVFNGWFSFNETPTVRMTLALICIFLGVVIGMKKNPPVLKPSVSASLKPIRKSA